MGTANFGWLQVTTRHISCLAEGIKIEVRVGSILPKGNTVRVFLFVLL